MDDCFSGGYNLGEANKLQMKRQGLLNRGLFHFRKGCLNRPEFINIPKNVKKMIHQTSDTPQLHMSCRKYYTYMFCLS